MNFYMMIPSLEIYKDRHYEAAACKVKRENRIIGGSLKRIAPDCFKTEGIYATVF